MDSEKLINYDPGGIWSPRIQSTDRAHRIEQRASVQMYKFTLKDSIEERILDLQEKKAGLMDAVSDGSDERILPMSR